MLGIEGGQIILPAESTRPMLGIWTFDFYEGEIERNDCGRIINPHLSSHVLKNLITTVGKQLTLDRLFGLSAAIAISGTAVGTSATAAAIGDTAITGAVYKVFDATPVRSALTVTAITTYNTAEANINIQEAGLLTASGGVLFNRLAPIGPFTKSAAVSLSITTQITQS